MLFRSMLEDQYMFGRDILFAPITKQGVTERSVYLPKGEWINVNSKEMCCGEQWMDCKASIDTFIAFVRKGCEVLEVFS